MRGGSFWDKGRYNVGYRLTRDNPTNSNDIFGNRTARIVLYLYY